MKSEAVALPLQDKRVLVIEDKAENTRLFRAVLKLEGAQVFEAAEAEVGIEMARREQPDIILMDVQMPGMDGLTATRLLRADAQTRAIPIIAVTASVMERDRQQILEAGCDGHISKPINPQTFGEQIAAFLPHATNSNPG